MRKLIYLVVFILVILAITPAVNGLFVKKFLENYMERYVLGTNSPTYSVKLKEYQQGWFTSLAIFQITFNSPQKQYDFSFDIVEDITHGPIIFDKAKHTFKVGFVNTNFKINYPVGLQIFLDLADKNAPFLHGTTLFAFNGAATSEIFLNPIITKPLMGTTLNWQGFKANNSMTLVDGLITSVSQIVEVGNFSVVSSAPDAPQITIAPWTITGNGKLDSVQLWSIQGNANFPHMSFTGMNNATATIDQLNFTFNHDVKNHEFYSITHEISLQKFVLPHGPIAAVGPAKIQLAVQDLSAQEVLKFYNMVQENSPHRTMTMEQREAFKTQARDALIKILTPTTAVNINADINTSLGQFLLSGTFNHFVERTGLSTPEQLQKNTKGEVHLKISAGLFKASVSNYITSMQGPSNMGPSMPDGNMSTPDSEKAKMDLFDEKVAEYIKSGKITLPDAMAIMSLQKKNLPNADFNTQLADFHLDKDVNDDLVKTYADIHVVYESSPATASDVATATPVAPTTAEQPTTPAEPTPGSNDEAAQAMIDQFVAQGYFVKENDNYVTTVIIENGTVKVNGVLLSP